MGNRHCALALCFVYQSGDGYIDCLGVLRFEKLAFDRLRGHHALDFLKLLVTQLA